MRCPRSRPAESTWLTEQTSEVADQPSPRCLRSQVKLPHFPENVGFLEHFPENFGFLKHFPENFGFLEHFSESVGYLGHFPENVGFLEHFPENVGFLEHFPGQEARSASRSKKRLMEL